MERGRKFWAEIGRIEMDTVLSTGHYFLFCKDNMSSKCSDNDSINIAAAKSYLKRHVV